MSIVHKKNLTPMKKSYKLRNNAILILFKHGGLNKAQIARVFKLSRERIGQILELKGVPRMSCPHKLLDSKNVKD